MRTVPRTGVRLAALLLVCSAAAFAAGFLGPEACKACHPAAYQAWKRSKHARAEESLTPDQRKEARCQICHAPDLKKTGVGEVTCETCHGGGQYYSASYVMKDAELSRLVGLKDPSERTCSTCHDQASPSLEPFDFKTKLALIDHWSQEKAKQQAASEAKAQASKQK